MQARESALAGCTHRECAQSLDEMLFTWPTAHSLTLLVCFRLIVRRFFAWNWSKAGKALNSGLSAVLSCLRPDRELVPC